MRILTSPLLSLPFGRAAFDGEQVLPIPEKGSDIGPEGRADLIVLDSTIALEQAQSLMTRFKPGVLLQISGLGDFAPHVYPTGAFPGWVRAFDRPFEAESFGSPFIARYRVAAFVDRRVEPPVRTHGPGAPPVEGKIPLWSKLPFLSRGTVLDPQDREVMVAIQRAWQGEIPLPILPGVASLLPRAMHQVGDRQGVLCLDGVDARRPASFSLLSKSDILEILGYKADDALDYAEVRQRMPVIFARTWLTFAASHPAPPSLVIAS